MAGKRVYVLVEGYGEVDALPNLLYRLSDEFKIYLQWAKPLRWPNIHQWEARRRGGVKAGLEFIRTKKDVGALLIVRDADDECPKFLGPEMARRIRSLNPAFPVSYVLLRPEYEVLFLPCLEQLGYPPWDAETWESRRGIKEWLSGKLPRGRSYKPTVDQLALTRGLDLAVLRDAEIPCFGSLERAVQFLSDNLERTGAVYP